MGCVSSKAFKKPRTRDLVVTNNGGKSCPNHVVSLTSSTYGLLNLENENPQGKEVAIAETPERSKPKSSSPPPCRREPEVINAWELMEDLEENIPITEQSKRSPKSGVFVRQSPMKLPDRIASPMKNTKWTGGKENRERYGSGRFGTKSADCTPKDRALKPRNSTEISSPAVKRTPMDSKREIFPTISSVKRSFSPRKLPGGGGGEGEEQIKKMVSPSPRTRRQRRSREHAESILQSLEQKPLPGGENAVVIYTTTLRGIRKTFEDCNKVRSILESHDVLVFERDISMDSGFKEELRKLLMGTKVVRVPTMFVKGRMVGGADEVVKMEEEGKLGVLFEGLARAAAAGCDGCGGFRFVMCAACNGSCKVLDDQHAKKMVRCGECNENGLIRCPICSC